LGNPGPDYRNSWHNLGYRVIEKLLQEFKLNFSAGKGEFLLARRKIATRETILMKPLSYMNLSGQPVLQIVEQEDLFHDNLLVVCDDINLPLGKIRLRAKGSDGGHKGLASIIYYLGTENFPRLRMGISTPERVPELKDYVLSEISPKYAEEVNLMLEKAVSAVECFIRDGLLVAMNKFNLTEETNLTEEINIK
jgi:PTH1 family peptidyl-tRNA hydrolase